MHFTHNLGLMDGLWFTSTFGLAIRVHAFQVASDDEWFDSDLSALLVNSICDDRLICGSIFADC